MKSLTVQHIALRLKRARLEKGITQSELSALLNVPQSYIAKVEAGRTDLRSSTMLEIAKLLDLEVLFISLKDLPQVASALADAKITRQKIHSSAYEPDEDGDDEEGNQ
jgi:transcriptional regulator with XRE-family HTH domain